MRYTMEGSDILRGKYNIAHFETPEGARTVLDLLQKAYFDGKSDKEHEYEMAKYDTRRKVNLRWFLHVLLGIALLVLVLAFTYLPAGWLLLALGSCVAAGGSLYGLGRIKRVTF